MSKYATAEEEWRAYLMGEHAMLHRHHRLFRHLPSETRCKLCQVPFERPGSLIARLVGKQPSNMNPFICNVCERAAKMHPGGAEVELSMLFADVRGSTRMAEQMSNIAYTHLITRFYNAAANILAHSHAFIDKLVGDQVTGYYLPGWVGEDHTRIVIQAAQDLLQATGYGDADGPGFRSAWGCIPVWRMSGLLPHIVGFMTSPPWATR